MRDAESTSPSLPWKNTTRSLQPEGGSPPQPDCADTLISDSSPQTMRNKFLLPVVLHDSSPNRLSHPRRYSESNPEALLGISAQWSKVEDSGTCGGTGPGGEHPGVPRARMFREQQIVSEGQGQTEGLPKEETRGERTRKAF